MRPRSRSVWLAMALALANASAGANANASASASANAKAGANANAQATAAEGLTLAELDHLLAPLSDTSGAEARRGAVLRVGELGSNATTAIAAKLDMLRADRSDLAAMVKLAVHERHDRD